MVLMESVQREMEEEQAYRAAVLAARRAEAALEESGSVYVGVHMPRHGKDSRRSHMLLATATLSEETTRASLVWATWSHATSSQ